MEDINSDLATEEIIREDAPYVDDETMKILSEKIDAIENAPYTRQSFRELWDLETTP